MSLIIALDPEPGMGADRIAEWITGICRRTSGYVAGYKIGLPALLETGLGRASRILERCDARLRIADLKLADIGYIMGIVAEDLLKAGFNIIIAHAFTGYRDALETLSRKLGERNGRLVTVVSMSHKGSEEIMDRVVDSLLDVSSKAGAWGVVMPATRPHLIRMGKNAGFKVLSPGIGAQGAEPGTALCAGADYEIVGRLITRSSDPGQAAESVLEAQRRMVRECRS